MKTVVFGMGSGRCGSASLSYLLNEQEGAYVGHELGPILPWDTKDQTGIQFRWEQLQHQSHLYPVVGDVGMYYLPYIPMLMKSHAMVPFINQNYVLKFVILQRDRDAVVKSYLRHFARQNNNPLQTEKAEGVKVDEWDECFPKYDGVTLEEAIGLFYDDYYAYAEKMIEAFPNNAALFSTEDMNSSAGVTKILGFVGITEPRVVTELKKNASQ